VSSALSAKQENRNPPAAAGNLCANSLKSPDYDAGRLSPLTRAKLNPTWKNQSANRKTTPTLNFAWPLSFSCGLNRAERTGQPICPSSRTRPEAKWGPLTQCPVLAWAKPGCAVVPALPTSACPALRARPLQGPPPPLSGEMLNLPYQ
jgi:hypothetical protein